ncbi:4-aminobutyrate aminotransferase and related aminotransferases [Pelotomaculum thermopropionicum SI]|uniref:(S)-3-amino-2-methylpropionate transaminase n=1 Tax=Pelotomaculum thermopropionicum (strain DSM 13744 / JCM 10971 / SI) TaxID=370438 RepID=A5D325_PELTS|nr:4-aminobutyrate aminotransferase and related aminotransferases [Pelotomaculum thermopropionicum SI]
MLFLLAQHLLIYFVSHSLLTLNGPISKGAEALINIKTEIPGPKSLELLELRKKYVPKGISNSGQVFAGEAEGAVITDVDGNRYIDFATGIGVINVGHRHEKVVKAAKEQIDKYIHTSFNVIMYEPYVRLAEKLAAITPGSFPKKTMFANSGAEAVENAVKIARKYTKRTGIIALECAFHGRTLMTMTLTSKIRPYKYGFGPFAPEVYKIPSAYCYRCYFGLEYPSCDMRCLSNLERFFVAEQPADNIAALIAEPVQGEGGFIVPPPEFLPGLKQICEKYGILFVVDEIQTGFGRTGKLFACEHFGLAPDIITIAKSLAAGFPLSAVTGRAEIMDSPDPGEIGGTYGGNPVSCAAALQVIDIMQEEKLPERAARIGARIQQSLKELQEKYQVIGDVRGLGAMVAVELVKDRKTKEPAKEITGQLISECYKQGLIVLSAGIYSNVMRFLPPLIIGDDELNWALAVLEKAFEKVCGKN